MTTYRELQQQFGFDLTHTQLWFGILMVWLMTEHYTTSKLILRPICSLFKKLLFHSMADMVAPSTRSQSDSTFLFWKTANSAVSIWRNHWLTQQPHLKYNGSCRPRFWVPWFLSNGRHPKLRRPCQWHHLAYRCFPNFSSEKKITPILHFLSL